MCLIFVIYTINKLQHRKCFVRIFIHSLQDFGKLTRSLRSLVRFPKSCNSWIKIRTSHFLWSHLFIPHKWTVLFARADWLARRWLAKYYSPPSSRRKKNGFRRYIFTNKVALWAASYSACVVYTKPIIHLSVGESGGYLPPLRWIIVNYSHILIDSYLLSNEYKDRLHSITSLLKSYRLSTYSMPAWGNSHLTLHSRQFSLE